MFTKRLYSFFWRLGGAIVVFALAWLSENIGLLELPLYAQGIIVLILNEATKAWSKYQAKHGKNFVGGQLN